MKLSDKIEGYDSMSAEDKLKELEALEIEDDSSKLKKLLNDANAEASKYKKELKAKQEELNSKLTEQERAEKERQAKEAEREEMLNKLLKEKNVAEQKANFLKQGYSEELATTSANALIDGDFKTVFDNLGTFISDRDKQAQVKALDDAKRPTGGDPAPKVTKEQFNKMSYAERSELFEKDKELYDSLKGE